MWNEPSPQQLARIPALYATEDQDPLNKVIWEHFFLGRCDWYAAEYKPQERVFFGYAILNGDLLNSEWGYFSLDEMREVNVHGVEIDRELHWEPRAARDVPKIVETYRAKGLLSEPP